MRRANQSKPFCNAQIAFDTRSSGGRIRECTGRLKVKSGLLCSLPDGAIINASWNTHERIVKSKLLALRGCGDGYAGSV